MPIANGITLPNALSNGTTADAVPVMANYNTLLNALNRALLDSGGTAGMNAQSTVIHNLSPGVASTDAVNLSQITNVWLPLSGGTLTGGLTGTTLSLSSTLGVTGASSLGAVTASGLLTINGGATHTDGTFPITKAQAPSIYSAFTVQANGVGANAFQSIVVNGSILASTAANFLATATPDVVTFSGWGVRGNQGGTPGTNPLVVANFGGWFENNSALVWVTEIDCNNEGATQSEGTDGGGIALALNTGSTFSPDTAMAVRRFTGAGTGPGYLRGINIEGARNVGVRVMAMNPALITCTPAAPGTINSFVTGVGGDSQYRFTFDHNGTHNWGPGNAVADVTLTRSGVGQMAFTGVLNVTSPTLGNAALTLTGSSTAGSGTTSLLKLSDPNNTLGVNLLLVGNGGTTPAKTIRVNGGALQVVNNAYSGIPFSLDDAGNLTITGTFIPGAAPQPLVQLVASAATVTPTFDNDMVDITAQAVALNLANPTVGTKNTTALNGAGMVIRIKDNGTARAITYGTQYTAVGLVLPTTTIAGKVLILGMMYNSNLTRWEVVSQAQE